jgi:hypothetical protein
LVLQMQLGVSAMPCTAHLPAQPSQARLVWGLADAIERETEGPAGGRVRVVSRAGGREAAGRAPVEPVAAIDDAGSGTV